MQRNCDDELLNCIGSKVAVTVPLPPPEATGLLARVNVPEQAPSVYSLNSTWPVGSGPPNCPTTVATSVTLVPVAPMELIALLMAVTPEFGLPMKMFVLIEVDNVSIVSGSQGNKPV